MNGREIGMTTAMVPLEQGFLGSGKIAIALINGGKVTFHTHVYRALTRKRQPSGTGGDRQVVAMLIEDAKEQGAMTMNSHALVVKPDMGTALRVLEAPVGEKLLRTEETTAGRGDMKAGQIEVMKLLLTVDNRPVTDTLSSGMQTIGETTERNRVRESMVVPVTKSPESQVIDMDAPVSQMTGKVEAAC